MPTAIKLDHRRPITYESALNKDANIISQAAYLEAWETITHERIKDSIREMPQRCKAVIKAQGAYTKY